MDDVRTGSRRRFDRRVPTDTVFVMALARGALGLGAAAAPRRPRGLGGIWVVLVSLALLTACGGGGDGGGGSKSKDTTPPVISDVYVKFTKISGSLNLSSADAQRILKGPTPLNIQVAATDDVTSSDALKVEALDVDDKPIADQSASLHNGLWNVTTTAEPGLTIQVAVTDQAGNQTIWPYSAIFPTREQAVVRQWTLLVYGPTNTVISRPGLTMTKDTWCQEDDAAGDGPAGGTWSMQSDGRLKMETRGHAVCTSSGGNDGNILSSRTSAFYVDGTFFSDGPYENQNGSSGSTDIVGTWTRTADIATTGPAQSVTSSLTLLADKTFQQTTEDGHQITGTYQQEHNTDYNTDFGDLLLLTMTKMDGTDVTPSTAVHYWTIKDGKLLLDPFVATQ